MLRRIKIKKAEEKAKMKDNKAYSGIGNFRDVPEELVNLFDMADQ